MSFILEFLKHPRRIGAVAPSGRLLARAMTSPIDFDSAKVIVEYGPGTGAFTRELIARRRPGTVLVLIEQNETFFAALQERYAGAGDVYLINGTAADVNEHLARLGLKGADYILSGLPFSSLPAETSELILGATRRAIGGGVFVTFQYTLMKEELLKRHFRVVTRTWVSFNIPPAFVFVMRNGGGDHS